MFLKKLFIKSVHRITNDFKQKELLPLKLVFFVQASTLSVLYPYITIHMRELGINVEEAAIMSAVIPIIGIFMPPLAGMVADKIGNFKLLLAFFSFVGGAVALLLLLVPVGRITVTYPDRVILSMGCDDVSSNDRSGTKLKLGFSDDIFCSVPSDFNTSKFYDLKFEGCGFVCRLSNQNYSYAMENPADFLLTGRSYKVLIKTNDADDVTYREYNLTKDDVIKLKTKQDVISNRILPNDVRLRKSIRRITSTQYYFPAMELSELNCFKNDGDGDGGGGDVDENGENVICHFGKIKKKNDSINERSTTMTTTTTTVLRLNKTMNFKLERIRSDSTVDDVDEFVTAFVTWSNGNKSNVTTVNSSYCESNKNDDVSVLVNLHNPDNNLEIMETIPLTECKPRCLGTTQRKSICSNLKEEVVYNPKLTFWNYLVIRIFIGIIGSTAYAMYEVAVIAILREHKADYGLQRIYASIGGMIASPLSGLLIDYASKGKGYTDFRPAFYLYAALKISTSLLMLFINLEFKKAASNVISDAIQVLKNLEVIALLIACFVLGSAWGYIESFLFWFLEDLGGSRSLMGITITIGGIAGIPLLVLSGPIIDKIGHANVIFIGFIFYGVRLVGYSVIYNPYHCLYFEAMESITSSLAITAAVTYAAKLSTTTTDGSIQGLVGGLYFGVGRGAGSLIGGYLMEALGTRETYRVFALFTVVTGFMYYLFIKFYIMKRPRVEGNDICKKVEKPCKNDVDVTVITQKPTDDNKKTETLKLDNNNFDLGKQIIDKKKVEEEEEEEEKIKSSSKHLEKQSHNNPAYVPDADETKKED